MIGRTISHYAVKERLGGGGMGVVYRAEDTRLGRPVALKFLPPELTRDPTARERFIHEARAASALDHPNICTIHDIGETPEGESFICMAYCEGRTLKQRLRDGPLPVDEAVAIAEQICEGLARAHEHGIVHRDIKPANVMVAADGHVTIVDFGLAKLAGSSSLTQTGMVVGTAAYVSPEQARGASADHRADLWSLGVVLFEMVTGRLPFRADHVQALLLSVVHDSEPLVTSLRPDIPTELARVIHRCLRKTPAERYQGAAELRSDLRRIRLAIEVGAEPTASTPTVTAAVTRRRRRWLLAAATVVAALVLVAAPGGHKWLRQLTRPGPLLPEEKHLAILPLANVGGGTADQAFCDGLVETVASSLTQLAAASDALWVVPASEVRRAAIASADEARRRFGVNLVVTGSVQRAAELVRVTLNVVDATSLRQLASAVIDDRTADLSEVQDGVGRRLAAMLEVTAAGPAPERAAGAASSAPGAFTLYLEGRGALLRYERVENIEAAIAAFEGALEKDGEFAAAHAGLAEACFRMWGARHDATWITRAERACTRALTLEPALGPALVTLGMLRNGTGRHEEAVAVLERAIRAEPGNATAYQELARAYTVLGRPAEAEATYHKAVAASPGGWSAYNTLGVFYLEQGRLEEAADQFRRVIEVAPDNFWGYNNLGGLHLYLGEREQARLDFERSIAVEPNYGAFSNLGTIAFQAGRYDEAARMYEQALAIDAGDYAVWGNLAAARQWSGERAERAAPLYQRAAEMAEQRRTVNPRDAVVLADLAAYRAELGEAGAAAALLEQAVAIAPTDVNVLFQAAVTCERLGRRPRAIELLAAALAHGYPRDDVMRAPGLAGLRADPAFARLDAPAAGRR